MKKDISIVGPDSKPSPISQDPNFNLAMSEVVKDALDEKCQRVNQLEKYCKELKDQYKREVGELKQWIKIISEENLRFKKLLKENGINW